MTRYRFALRPKWILSHLFVLALVAAMMTAGFWQLSRRDEKRSRNEQITQRATLAVTPVGDLLDGPDAATDGLEYRVASASGTYLPEQVMIRSRSLGGQPGSWVVTPLRLDDGRVVLVNRGFFYNNGQLTEVPARYAPPAGEVEVVGLLRETQTRGSIGAKDADEGHLTNLARLDVERIARQVDGPVLPMYLSLEDQRPSLGPDDPTPVPREDLDEGPHFGYAVQWFIFTAIAVIGYPLILRRRANELEKEARARAAASAEGEDEGEPAGEDAQPSP